MSYKHLFLDFDQTLFDHWAFAAWMDEFFVKRFDTKPHVFTSGFDEHHDDLPDGLRLYRHAEHIKKATGREWSYVSGELERQCRQSGRDFCYPEVHEMLSRLDVGQHDVRILTFGSGEYQRFKINSCGVLRSSQLGVHVVNEPKGTFLEREFPEVTGILVDDKFPLSLPASWHHIWISRNIVLDRPQKRKDGVIQISSMSQLQHALELFEINLVDQ